MNSILPNQALGAISPRLLAFFDVFMKCAKLDDMPHPILVRNTGLMKAWQNLATWRGYPDALADQLANPRFDLAHNTAMIAHMLFSGPGWNPNHVIAKLDAIESLASMVAVSLMYWQRPHALIELTSTLEQWLARSDLGDDIPADLLRPPVPACYIRFGPELQAAIAPSPERDSANGRIEGVYVLESMRDDLRSIVLRPIIVGRDRVWRMNGVQMLIGNREQQPLVSFIQDAVNSTPEVDLPGMVEHLQSITQLCIKVFLYMSLSQAQQVEQTPYSEALIQLKRVGPKKAAKLHRQVDKRYDRILLGPQILPQHAPGVHGEVSPHWRRGHFRLQVHGPRNSLRKVIFTAPILVRADRLAADTGNTAAQPNDSSR